MTTTPSNDSPTAVRYSGYLPLPTAVALGSCLSVGLGLYLLIGPVFRLVGSRTPAAYLLTIIFFAPLVLTLAERMAAIPGSGGLFNLIRKQENLLLVFLNGWLLLGGTLFLGAMLTIGAGFYLHLGLQRYFSVSLPASGLAALFLALITLYQFYGSYAQWPRRGVLLWSTILLLPLLLLWVWLRPPQSASGYAYILQGQELQAIPYLALSLWGLSFLVEKRQQLQQPARWTLPVLTLPILLSGLLGGWTAVTLLQYPRLVSGNLVPLVALAAAVGPAFELLIYLAALFLAAFGLHQTLISAVRLAGLLTERGFLHPEFNRPHPQHRFPVYTLIFFAALIGLCQFLFDPGQIATAAAGTLLLALILIQLPGLFSTRSPLPPNRHLKLPLHPLFPALTIVISFSMATLPPLSSQWLLMLWGAGGLVQYLLYARTNGIARRQQTEMVIETRGPKIGSQMLVAVAEINEGVDLVATAVTLAQARLAQLTLMHVIVLPEQTPDNVREAEARQAWQQLSQLAATYAQSGVTITPIVRIAPTAVAGVMTTIWEEKSDSVILGWPRPVGEHEREVDGLVSHVVTHARCEVIIPHRPLPSRFDRILTPMVSDDHAQAALALAQALARRDQGTAVALGMVREALNPERSAAAYDRLQGAIDKLDNQAGVEPLVEHAKNSKEQIMANAPEYDLVLMGLSNEGFLALTHFGGDPVEIALASPAATMLVKSHEPSVTFWLRQMWERLFNVLPTLTGSEQATVYLEMRRSAKASIDFYVLILLATAIAYFGLLQGSDAVIIGAMLVAPLMSPILALAQGVVQGNANLMRTAAHSTFYGALVAVMLATFTTLFLYSLGSPLTATPSILARTSPGLLDLLVALASGAVAAYATSRSSVAGALPGVAIAAALVPPLAVVGYGLGLADFEYAGGALLLFLTNLAAIVLAAALVFLLLGFRPPQRIERDEQAKFGLRIALLALALVSLPLTVTTIASQRQTERNQTVDVILTSYWPPNEALVSNIEVERNRDEVVVSCLILDFSGQATTADIAILQERLTAALDSAVTLEAVISQAQLNIVDEDFDVTVLTPTVAPTIEPTAVPAALTPLPSPTLPPASATLPPTLTATAVINTTATPASTPTP